MPANKIKIDNAILKRYQKQSTRRKKRIILCNILIVCEGTETEPKYFAAFRKFNRGTVVYNLEIEGRGENTIQVVDRAIELRDKNKGTEREYDRVWAVFDKDDFDKNFNKAINKAESNNISCAWSNEAFELWYLYHFLNRITAMSRDEYKKSISKAVNRSPLYKSKEPYEYKKNDEQNYEIMNKYGSQKEAINNAMSQSLYYSDKCYAKHNPCTMVYKLVLQLIGEDSELNEELKNKI